MHSKAKFFFIKNKIEDGEMRVVNCPPERMWAYVLTEPLQGTVFQKMRAKLMNCEDNYEDNESIKEKKAKAEPVSGKDT